MFSSGGSLPYFARAKTKKNLSSCLSLLTNLPEERVRVLLSKKELSELPDDSSNIFKKSNIDRYMKRPNATFCNGKYK